jgi:hypothetical protein
MPLLSSSSFHHTGGGSRPASQVPGSGSRILRTTPTHPAQQQTSPPASGGRGEGRPTLRNRPSLSGTGAGGPHPALAGTSPAAPTLNGTGGMSLPGSGDYEALPLPPSPGQGSGGLSTASSVAVVSSAPGERVRRLLRESRHTYITRAMMVNTVGGRDVQHSAPAVISSALRHPLLVLLCLFAGAPLSAQAAMAIIEGSDTEPEPGSAPGTSQAPQQKQQQAGTPGATAVAEATHLLPAPAAATLGGSSSAPIGGGASAPDGVHTHSPRTPAKLGLGATSSEITASEEVVGSGGQKQATTKGRVSTLLASMSLSPQSNSTASGAPASEAGAGVAVSAGPRPASRPPLRLPSLKDFRKPSLTSLAPLPKREGSVTSPPGSTLSVADSTQGGPLGASSSTGPGAE